MSKNVFPAMTASRDLDVRLPYDVAAARRLMAKQLMNEQFVTLNGDDARPI